MAGPVFDHPPGGLKAQCPQSAGNEIGCVRIKAKRIVFLQGSDRLAGSSLQAGGEYPVPPDGRQVFGAALQNRCQKCISPCLKMIRIFRYGIEIDEPSPQMGIFQGRRSPDAPQRRLQYGEPRPFTGRSNPIMLQPIDGHGSAGDQPQPGMTILHHAGQNVQNLRNRKNGLEQAFPQ